MRSILLALCVGYYLGTRRKPVSVVADFKLRGADLVGCARSHDYRNYRAL